MKRFTKKILNNMPLVMQVLGCCMIVLATYLLSQIAALFVAGGMILGWGILIEFTKEGEKHGNS